VTNPYDPAALLWNSPRPPERQPSPGKEIWRLQREGLVMTCELRDRGEQGAELQVLLDGELMDGQLYPNEVLAVNAASKRFASAKSSGWTQAITENVPVTPPDEGG
jgi:hypothetical protein